MAEYGKIERKRAGKQAVSTESYYVFNLNRVKKKKKKQTETRYGIIHSPE